MRKKLKIIFLFCTFLYFGQLILPREIKLDSFIYEILYAIVLIPYLIYEFAELIKEDRMNKTNKFKNRIILMVIFTILLVLSSLYLNKLHEI